MSHKIISECPDFFLVGTIGSSFSDPIAECFSEDCGGVATHLHVYQREKWDGKVPTTIETISFD